MKKNLVLTVILVLAACKGPQGRYNSIKKIEIATGGCFGPCQSTVVSIDSTLQYRYYGGGVSFVLPADAKRDGKLEGYYTGHVSQSFWDSLNIKMERINYQKLDTSYQHSVDDQSLEVFIHYGDKVKHINAQSASLPDSVAAAFYQIVRSFKLVKLKKATDSIPFESTVQQPLPRPKIDQIKFPPPEIKK